MELDEKKLSVIRRYPQEFLIGILLFAVTFLIVKQSKIEDKVDKLQSETKTYLNADRTKMIEVLYDNTQTMKNTNRLLIEIRERIKGN